MESDYKKMWNDLKDQIRSLQIYYFDKHNSSLFEEVRNNNLAMSHTCGEIIKIMENKEKERG
jgi:hypothetical protein